MAYINQNYMTNKKIKAAVDKNQKGYQEEVTVLLGNLNISVMNDLEETIANASITLTDSDNNTYTAKSESDGGCSLKDIPIGTYSILAEAETYVSVTDEITIKEGDNTFNIIFTEQEIIASGEDLIGNLSISVKNDLEENIENALITLTDSNNNTYTAKSGSAGGCNIKDIPVGTYSVLAEAETYVNVTDEITIEEGNNTLNIIFTEQVIIGSGESMIDGDDEVDDDF